MPDLLNDVMFQNQTLFRSLPLAAGGFGLVSLLANRILSGVSRRGVPLWADPQLVNKPHAHTTSSRSACIDAAVGQEPPAGRRRPPRRLTCAPQIAPVVDASSSQSRSDVLGIVLSAVLLLTGLQWLSLKPKPVAAVALDGTEVLFTDEEAKLPPAAAKEMMWAWESLRANSRCR